MSQWCYVFAVVLGLFWYFSELGQFLVQVCCCALCFLIIFLVEGSSKACESSTQTERVADEDISQLQQKSETGHIVGSDEPDTAIRTVQKASQQSQYPNIQRSLQLMFKYVYTHLVLPWSTLPELGDKQPLHAALLKEFNFVMNEIICKAKDMDLSVTALGCIEILTRHLHSTKQSEGTPAFSSKAEEIAEVKGFCNVLIHNLLPKHLWEPNVYHYALQEILALKVLALVTLLSDPDNVNHLIVSQLDQTQLEILIEEVSDPDRDILLSSLSESSDMLHSETEEHPCEEHKAKKKAKKFKEKISKVFDFVNPKKTKLKSNKKKVKERAVSLRRPAVIETDSTNSNEGSICDSVGDNLESSTWSVEEEMMEFKLSYEMWRAGNWAVTVTNVQMEGDELCFTFHLEDRHNSEHLHWDVKRNQSVVIEFYDQCKKIGHQLSLMTIAEKPKAEWKMEEAREILEKSLQDLVANEEFGNSELVFKFLGPIDWILQEEERDKGVWFLLGEIASFLTPGQDDDEISNIKGDEKEHEVVHECNTSEATPQHELAATHPMCTDTLERQDKETDDELEADVGNLHTLDQMSTCTVEKQNADYTAHRTEIIAHFAARAKYLQFDHNFKPRAAACSAAESDEDRAIHRSTETLSDYKCTGNISKEENPLQRKSSDTDKPEKKGKDPNLEEETSIQPSGEKKISISLEQPEANKVIFDLLKEMSGNSYTFKIMKAVVTPFTPLINKKLNAFLNMMNPSEAQIASYIDRLCENIWPDPAVPQPPPQSSDKNEIKQKAMQLMTSKFSGLVIINKTNVESIFKTFQNAEENKKLVYMLLKYLLTRFLPGEPGFNVMSKYM
ncbi:hypothetical protein QTP70_020988 [Hemibagrus guttatus]|uniref:Sorting nexin C-terminal domain-containing protein n=1 Tax=Hemibagrus guttatus TaxID=175788 RepID=A0AAE0V2B0_9TELE|nr:hypothetical protein QTP70_020988 [Hemibagrus guttatus]KAK3564333.1 hypothetical protein QTP86_017362 [Hemibagrus guttatus]